MDKVTTASGIDFRVKATSKQLGDLITANDKYLWSKRFEAFDEILKGLDVTQLHEDYIICYARGTFMARSKLKEWKPFVERAVEELNRRGFDGKDVMRGLL